MVHFVSELCETFDLSPYDLEIVLNCVYYVKPVGRRLLKAEAYLFKQ